MPGPQEEFHYQQLLFADARFKSKLEGTVLAVERELINYLENVCKDIESVKKGEDPTVTLRRNNLAAIATGLISSSTVAVTAVSNGFIPQAAMQTPLPNAPDAINQIIGGYLQLKSMQDKKRLENANTSLHEEYRTQDLFDPIHTFAKKLVESYSYHISIHFNSVGIRTFAAGVTKRIGNQIGRKIYSLMSIDEILLRALFDAPNTGEKIETVEINGHTNKWSLHGLITKVGIVCPPTEETSQFTFPQKPTLQQPTDSTPLTSEQTNENQNALKRHKESCEALSNDANYQTFLRENSNYFIRARLVSINTIRDGQAVVSRREYEVNDSRTTKYGFRIAFRREITDVFGDRAYLGQFSITGSVSEGKSIKLIKKAEDDKKLIIDEALDNDEAKNRVEIRLVNPAFPKHTTFWSQENEPVDEQSCKCTIS